MKKLFFALFCVLVAAGTAGAKGIETASPDGKLRLTVDVAGEITYTVRADGAEVLEDCELSLMLSDRTLGVSPRLRSIKRTSADETVHRLIPTKNSVVQNRYNGIRLNFAGNYAVEFRVFNDGVAYRFVTSLPGQIEVLNELCRIGLPAESKSWLSQTGGFRTMYEEPYTCVKMSEYSPGERMSYLPVLTQIPEGPKVLLAEADVRDYPCMFVQSDGRGGFDALFPREPKSYGPDGDRSLKITAEEPYIARTSGTRPFPWRVAVVAGEDAALLENELVWLLAEPEAPTDWSWVKPGLISWDWWNGMRLTGVDFRAGRNTESYRYYIDFAAKYGIPYIIMDEGWSASTTDVFNPNADLDLQELIAYGKSKNVQIVLWLSWLAVEKDMERLFETYQKWGIPGVKIDFMDRSDQWMVNYYERVAKCAAEHRIFVDMHGSYTPKGLYRTYPNLLTYEGVLGLEQGGRCKPDNSNYLPFIRNAVGPMDFTPGSMFSAQPEDNRSTGSNPMGSGTRAYQMALYVVFESPLQMLSDNPVLYYREHPCTEFLASVPTTWDELRVLRAKCGDQVVVARRKGSKWYLGGITNDQPYSTEISLDFLPVGHNYTMTSFEDGVNADLQATDYKKRERKVDASSVVKIDMVRNGGWAAVIE
ncbi:glycoside hydrolase family 97 protein [uncultured Alistipes sp.]|uniref:glycoside hydrolase family 97 protein n=1 Tax=uncultured Alistipes sp. TaxID=538949 RepID=UPI0025DC2C86|nr:glycoside hydrolase family 97 protein [uncultured Alistipes sp.]